MESDSINRILVQRQQPSKSKEISSNLIDLTKVPECCVNELITKKSKQTVYFFRKKFIEDFSNVHFRFERPIR